MVFGKMGIVKSRIIIFKIVDKSILVPMFIYIF